MPERLSVTIAKLMVLWAGFMLGLGITVNVQLYGAPWHNTSPRYGNELCFGVEDSGACYRLTWHGVVARYSHPD